MLQETDMTRQGHEAVNPAHDIGCEKHRPDTPPVLYPFQQAAVDAIKSKIAEGHRRIILVAPTGSGKTVIASELIRRAVDKFQRALVLAHRREIIQQTSAKLRTNGVRHGIIQAGIDPRLMASVQVASVLTLWMRCVRNKIIPLPPADLLIVDECHHATAMTWRALIAAYPEAVLIGTTATPCRGDARGLGGIFQVMLQTPQVADLIGQGFLVKSRVYAPVDPDLRGVKTQAGDYVENQLADRMDRDKLVGDIVTHWHKFGERRRTVAFACSVGHSIHICDEFVKAGVRAEHLDGSTQKDERDAILARLKSGQTEVVTNCMVLTEGWDMPEVGCCILARPTKKMGLFRQMIGRVLRPAEGKTDAIVLDHSGAVFHHGLPEDSVEWSLDPDRCAESPTHQKRQSTRESKLIECTQCSALRVGGKPCPNCGFMPKHPAQYVAHREGDLGLVVNGKVRSGPMTTEQQLQFHRELRGFAALRGYKDAWAYYKCKEKGFSPPWAWNNYPPLEPSPAVASWARSRIIAYAKSRSAA
jgi:DNA repair protein RadD